MANVEPARAAREAIAGQNPGCVIQLRNGRQGEEFPYYYVAIKNGKEIDAEGFRTVHHADLAFPPGAGCSI